MPPRSSLICAALAILAVSSTALFWRGPVDTAGSPQSAIAEYRNEARKLTLAPGWHWPAMPPIDMNSGYGKGFGAGLADGLWFCSWASRAVSSSLPPSSRREALEQLRKVRDTASYEHLLPEERSREDAMIARALRGKTWSLRRHIKANCEAQ